MPDLLDSIRIAQPCPASWERMTGDERVRHCTMCDLNVYNFAAMTGDDIRELLLRSEGRVCARLYRRSDGTVLTKDCPSAARRLRRKWSRISNAIMAAVLSLASLATGCATNAKSRLTIRSTAAIEIARDSTIAHARFAGEVLDGSGLPLPGVSVTVRNEESKQEFTAVTDVHGMFEIASLQEGQYRVEVALVGFEPALAEHVSVQQNELALVQARLIVDETLIVTAGLLAFDPVPEPGRTTFTKEFLDKVPF